MLCAEMRKRDQEIFRPATPPPFLKCARVMLDSGHQYLVLDTLGDVFDDGLGGKILGHIGDARGRILVQLGHAHIRRTLLDLVGVAPVGIRVTMN